MKKTILLVEDEVLISMAEAIDLENYGYNTIIANSGEKAISLVKLSLENSNYTVITANSSNEAIKKFKDNKIDLILMDINLGKGLDGIETAETILKNYDIPIVFLSHHTEKEIVSKTERVTSYGYVVKNSGITVIDASIKMAFKLFEAKREIIEREKEYRILFQNMNSINSLYEVIFDENGKPYDYKYLQVSPAFEKLVNKTSSEIIGKTLLQIFPETEPIWIDKIGEAVMSGEVTKVDSYSKVLNIHIEIILFSLNKKHLIMSSPNVSLK